MKRSFLLGITLLFLIFGGISAFSYQGAVAKVPYPMIDQDLSLESQKVSIVAYSTFIEITGEYTVKNNQKYDTEALLGFPFYVNSQDLSKGEYLPIGFEVYKNKKQDYYVKEKVEKNGDITKHWYMWKIPIKGNRKEKFIVHYFLKIGREKGVPHITYIQTPAKTYKGNIKRSLLMVNLPINCEDMPLSIRKIYSGSQYMYISPSGFKRRRNIVKWEITNHVPNKDFEIYFYKNGYPDWEVRGYSDPKNTSKLLDGDKNTFWISNSLQKGVGSSFVFKPVLRKKDGRSFSFSPNVYKIGVVPGNCTNLSNFYRYSHLREAEVSLYKEPPKKKEEKKEKTKPEKVDRPSGIIIVEDFHENKDKDKKKDVIYIDCTADPILQIFGIGKPLETKGKPIVFKVLSVYPGQDEKALCIGEVLIFDRLPNEIYETL